MKKRSIIFWLLLIFSVTFIAYSNHFHNGFHFDDFHTITDNLYIRELKHIPLFFTDATTTSTLPYNQAYRPGLTTLNAIDYYLSGSKEVQPFSFHVSIFISYILLGVCLFFLFQHLLCTSLKSSYNTLLALFTTAWFLLHTANAETINYIIARSDSFSTLMIMLAFILYLFLPQLRKWHVYFIPVLIGFTVKETAMMFVLLLFLYKILFEAAPDKSMQHSFLRTMIHAGRQLLLPILVSLAMFALSRMYTPANWQPGGTSVWRYLFTQPFVLFHYCYNFILPVNLVVDTDWKPINRISDDQVLAGILFISALLYIAYINAATQKNKPITFGIAWFFIALLPTSSFIPFAEVLNDHRTFFPYIGLFLASACLLRNLLERYQVLQSNGKKILIGLLAALFLSAHAYGTYQRNKVWRTEKSLWLEATEKAPGNGRAWMNYGNALMLEGNFVDAIACYEKTIQLLPTYANAFINFAIAKSYLHEDAIAEANFLKGIQLSNNMVPDAFLFYGRFLLQRNRIPEAKKIIQQGLAISPKHQGLLDKLEELLKAERGNQLQPTGNNSINALLRSIQEAPTAEKFLDLSLQYYNAGRFQDCIDAANKSLAIKPDYDLAYNNICAAYNRLQQWTKSIEAGEKGLRINPNNQLLKGNLAEAYKAVKQ